ncbi:MAG: hypothetical protein HC923_03350 [Myxococcales bacterium]|nr:hypothetical protein [Myxococcales bacterium]
MGNTLEGAVLWSPIQDWRSWFRLNAGIQLRDFITLISPEPITIGFVPLIGPEVLIPPLTGSFVQTSVGARVGVQLSTRDRFSTDSCRPERDREDPRQCSQFVVQPQVAVSFLDRFRVQFSLDLFPNTPDGDFDDRVYEMFIGAGVVLY